MEKLTTPSQLREQAKRFQRAAGALRQAADILDGNVPGGDDDTAEPPVKRGSRLDQLRKYLVEHGPCDRATLLKRAGLPLGTLSTLLRKKEIFLRDDKGQWSVRDGGPAAGRDH